MTPIEALQQIEQMSDPGSYELAIVRMKAIATEALKLAAQPKQEAQQQGKRELFEWVKAIHKNDINVTEEGEYVHLKVTGIADTGFYREDKGMYDTNLHGLQSLEEIEWLKPVIIEQQGNIINDTDAVEFAYKIGVAILKQSFEVIDISLRKSVVEVSAIVKEFDKEGIDIITHPDF